MTDATKHYLLLPIIIPLVLLNALIVTVQALTIGFFCVVILGSDSYTPWGFD